MFDKEPTKADKWCGKPPAERPLQLSISFELITKENYDAKSISLNTRKVILTNTSDGDLDNISKEIERLVEAEAVDFIQRTRQSSLLTEQFHFKTKQEKLNGSSNKTDEAYEL